MILADHQNQSAKAERFGLRPTFSRAGERERDLMWGRFWFWLGTSAAVLSGGLALWTLRLAQESFFRLQNQHELIRATEELGYLLTGESSNLEPYNASRRALDTHLTTLRKLTGNNPKQQQQVERLSPLIQKNLHELAEAEGRNAAPVVVLGHRDQRLTDAILQILQEMEGDEQATLDRSTRIQRSRLRTSLIALFGSVSLAVCSLLISKIALGRNVSRRQKAEEELRASATLNRSILDSLPANIALVDRDGEIRTVNEGWNRFARENGDPSALLVGAGANYLEVCRRSAKDGSSDAREALIGLEEVLAGKRSIFRMQYQCATDTQTRWFRMSISRLAGAAGGAVIAHLDVTERKQAEERFRLVFEAASSGMVIIDQEGKIVLVNSRIEQLFGYGRQELLGQPVEILMPESFREGHVGLRTEFLAHPLARSMGAGRDLNARRKDGTQFPVEIGLNPIATQEGTWVLSSIIDISERKRAADALDESRQELRALAGRLLLAQEEERKRISRDLHDDLSQKVALLAFDTSSLVLATPQLPEEMKKSLCNLQTRIGGLAADLRQISHQLHPSILEDLGLVAALRELCEEFSTRAAIEAVLKEEEIPEILPADLAACLYRLAQEALHNVQKHARASHVRVTISGGSESIRLCIQDDGVGFSALPSGRSLGIISMKERVRLVLGDFSIYSQPGRGTTITVVVPLPGRQNETRESTVSR